ncbi:hypothetical protein E1182_08635 [Micromonospora sp. KC721]|nr:hypothetical protein E1182_08635 [Micromonospora sp. KC721]
MTTCSDAPGKACPRKRSSAASSAASPASSTSSSQQTIFNSRLDIYRSIFAGALISPRRSGDIVAAALHLTHFEHKYLPQSR